MNAYAVFIALLLIAVFWLYRLFIRPILRIFKRYKTAKATQQQGMPVQGTITASQYLGKASSRGFRLIRITVAFANFVGTLITEQFRFVDTKPYQNRFEVGKTIRLSLNDQAISSNRVTLADQTIKIKRKTLAIYLILWSTSVYLLYHYIAQPLWTKAHQDIHQLIPMFDSLAPALLVYIFSGTLVLIYFIFKLIDVALGKRPKGDFKYYGLQASAHINGYAKTGTRVNDNPMVKFDFTFTTNTGETIHSSDTQLIDELAIGRIHEIKQKEVMYLADAPQKAVFADNLHESPQIQTSKILNMVFQLILFIFSVTLFAITLPDLL